jgi:hypothetical protein
MVSGGRRPVKLCEMNDRRGFELLAFCARHRLRKT